MQITEKSCPRYVTKGRVNQYINFAQRNGYSIDERDINPVHIIKWVLEIARAEGLEIFQNRKFKSTCYYLMSNSKYPMSIFLKLQHIECLFKSCKHVDVNVLNKIFYLLLEASRRFATNPRGVDLIKDLPSEIPVERKPFKNNWFLTKTNECFKMLSVIDFYIWLDSEDLTFNITDEKEVANLLRSYCHYMKSVYPRGKHKKKVSLFHLQ